jgi:hypothetical protein
LQIKLRDSDQVYSHTVAKRIEDFRNVVQKQGMNLEQLWKQHVEVTEKLEATMRMLKGTTGGQQARQDGGEDYMTAKARIQQAFKAEAEAVLSRYQAKTKALQLRVEKHEDVSVVDEAADRSVLTSLQSWRKKKQLQENAKKEYEKMLKQIADAAGDEIDDDDNDEDDETED